MNVSLLSPHYWLSLPKKTRDKLVKLLNIPKTGSSLVTYGSTGSVVQSDGYSPEDLMAVSVEKMQELLGSDSTDFYALFNDVVMNVDDLLNPKEEVEIIEKVEIDIIKKPKAKKNEKPKAKKNSEN